MGILVALIPALLWGINPSLVKKIDARAQKQQLGTTLGATIFALIVFFCTLTTSIDDLSTDDYAVYYIPFLSGLSWAIGQYLQYLAFGLLGTTMAFSLGTGLHVIFNAFFSYFLFSEWRSTYQIALGFSAVGVMFIGCVFSALHEKNDQVRDKKRFLLGLLIVIISAMFLTLYSAIPKLVTTEGVEPTSTLLPQCVGMIIGAVIVNVICHLVERREVKKDPAFIKTKLFDRQLLLTLIPGLLWGGANLGLIYANQMVGTAIGFTISNLCTAISTLISLFIMKEYKTMSRRELAFSITGMVLITAGCVMIGFTM